jgi:outer membrane protein assembly factor BamD (BamD/ComL family)
MLIPEKSDEQSIQFAFKSALSYIANFPKGANLDDAIAIATDCVTKIAQLHRTIAEYYVTIENKPGAEYHFKLASGLPKDVATNEVYPILGSQESQGDSSEAELTLSSQQFVGIGARWGEYVE